MQIIWILFLCSFWIATGLAKIDCRNTQKCVCYPGAPYEFQCPPDYSSVGGIVMHISENDSVLIDCYARKDKFDVNILPNIHLKGINEFTMRFCALPEHNFKEILNGLSLNETKILKYSSSNLENITFSKDYFVGLEHLEQLSLESLDLMYVDEDLFDNTPNLLLIKLLYNRLRLRPKLFEKTVLLKSLEIASNKLTELPDYIFQNLSNLRSLYLWDDGITSLGDNTFVGLTNLTLLEMAANQISNISENAFRSLVKLSRLSLRQNRLSELPMNLFSNNVQLEFVRMDKNPNLQIPDDLFSKLSLLKEVILSHCNLKSLPEHIFKGCSSLNIINLQSNNLKSLGRDLFKDLSNLTELYLNDNAIETLDDTFSTLKMLEKLHLQDNLITNIGPNAFSNLVHLKELYISNNRITTIDARAFHKTKELIKVNLAHNFFSNTDSQFELLFDACLNLEYLDVSHNLITNFENVLGLYNKLHLTFVDMSYNRITSIRVNGLQVIGSQNIVINLSNNNITWVDFEATEALALDQYQLSGYPYNVPNSLIHLENNPITCDCHNYDLLRYFKDEMVPQVKVMFDLKSENLTCAQPSELKDLAFESLSGSLLVCPIEHCHDICECLWRPFDTSIIVDCSNRNLEVAPEISLPQIRYNQTEVHLEMNHLSEGPGWNQSGYENVTRLFLSNNNITKIKWLPPKLEVLKLDNNKLKHLDYSTLNALNNSNLVKLSLHDNPWVCDCSAANFTDHLRQHSKQIDVKDVRCVENGKLVMNLNKDSLCHNLTWTYVVLIVILLSLLSVATMAALYYRYRQEIKVWLFAKNLCLWWVTEDEVDKDKVYDAFISFSHKDEEFVVQNLLPVLEGGPHPYKLCIHYRNFIPGEFIAKQIINSVNDSRRTLVVLSSNFLESVWGKMEFRTAHTQMMDEGRARVIVVLYGDVDIDSLDNELKAYLRTNTYVKWGDPYFWNKLRFALPHANRRGVINNQKHANVMRCIDDKFNLVNPVVMSDPRSTPPVQNLDPSLLTKHPLNFAIKSDVNNKPPPETLLMTNVSNV